MIELGARDLAERGARARRRGRAALRRARALPARERRALARLGAGAAGHVLRPSGLRPGARAAERPLRQASRCRRRASRRATTARTWRTSCAPPATCSCAASSPREEIAGFLEEAEQLRGEAVPGDKLSWWGKDARGEAILCRVTRAAAKPRLRSLPSDPRVVALKDLADEKLEHRRPASEEEGVSIIWKHPEMREGLGDLPWHRDCGMGGHAIMCPVLIVSVFLTPATAESGALRMLPGSWQASCGPIDARDARAPRGVHLQRAARRRLAPLRRHHARGAAAHARRSPGLPRERGDGLRAAGRPAPPRPQLQRGAPPPRGRPGRAPDPADGTRVRSPMTPRAAG